MESIVPIGAVQRQSSCQVGWMTCVFLDVGSSQGGRPSPPASARQWHTQRGGRGWGVIPMSAGALGERPGHPSLKIVAVQGLRRRYSPTSAGTSKSLLSIYNDTFLIVNIPRLLPTVSRITLDLIFPSPAGEGLQWVSCVSYLLSGLFYLDLGKPPLFSPHTGLGAPPTDACQIRRAGLITVWLGNPEFLVGTGG
jgi:hypothetical protein